MSSPTRLAPWTIAVSAIAIFMVAYAVVRRRTLRNADILILIASGLGLFLVAGTDMLGVARPVQPRPSPWRGSAPSSLPTGPGCATCGG